MQPFVDDLPANVAGLEPTGFATPTSTPHATQARRSVSWRRAALWAGLAAAPVAAGYVVSRLTSRRTGILAGSLTALAIGTLRVELARWFTPEPAFHTEGELGDLELRHYPARIEARATVANPGLEGALDAGYSRLAAYHYGANAGDEMVARTTPVLTAMRNGSYEVSFVMPPDRTLETLPQPNHPGIELLEVPAHRVAVLPFRGRFTRENVARHERMLLQRLVDTGLSARGSVSFAAFRLARDRAMAAAQRALDRGSLRCVAPPHTGHFTRSRAGVAERRTAFDGPVTLSPRSPCARPRPDRDAVLMISRVIDPGTLRAHDTRYGGFESCVELS